MERKCEKEKEREREGERMKTTHTQRDASMQACRHTKRIFTHMQNADTCTNREATDMCSHRSASTSSYTKHFRTGFWNEVLAPRKDRKSVNNEEDGFMTTWNPSKSSINSHLKCS